MDAFFVDLERFSISVATKVFKPEMSLSQRQNGNPLSANPEAI